MRFPPGRVLCALALAGVTAAAARAQTADPAAAQTPGQAAAEADRQRPIALPEHIPLPGEGPCTAEQLAFTLQAFRAPGNTHVLVLNYRNTGDNPCRLIRFALQNGQVAELRLRGGEMVNLPRTVLAPGGSAYSTLRWTTLPLTATPEEVAAASGRGSDKPCHANDAMNLHVGTPAMMALLTSFTLAPPRCSPLEDDTDYHPGSFVPNWPADDRQADPPLPPAPVLASSKQTFFENEQVPLRVELPDAAELAQAVDPSGGGPGCPVLLRSTQDASGRIRIEEVLNPVYWEAFFFPVPHDRLMPDGTPNPLRERNAGCRLGQGAPGQPMRFDVWLNSGIVWDGLGPHTFRIIRLDGYGADGELRQVASDSLPITVASAVDLPRTWSPADRGVRVGLALDRTTYRLGDDIPLHIATEDTAASLPVFDRLFGPQRGSFRRVPPEIFSVTHIAVVGPHGPLKPVPISWSGMEHPPCPEVYPKGRPVPLELRLSQVGLLPQEPGDYRITVSWSPYTSVETACESVGLSSEAAASAAPLTTVTTPPLTLHIEPPDGAPQFPPH